MKLINLSEVINEIERFKGYLDEDMIWRIKFTINRLPAVDAEPVRHGKWIYKVFQNGIGYFMCSECGHASWSDEYNYCFDCGAKMHEVNNENN